jgi:hypothetical protein
VRHAPGEQTPPLLSRRATSSARSSTNVFNEVNSVMDLDQTPKSGRQQRLRSQSMLMLRDNSSTEAKFALPASETAGRRATEAGSGMNTPPDVVDLNGGSSSGRSSSMLPEGSLYIGGPPTPKLPSDPAKLASRLARSEERVLSLEDKITMLHEQVRRLKMERDALSLDNERLRRVASSSPVAYGAAGLLPGGVGLLLPRGVAFENMSSTNV